MSDRLRLRRAMYEALPSVPRRWRRAVRRQIAVLSGPNDDLGGGSAGVREPRRTPPSAGPASLP